MSQHRIPLVKLLRAAWIIAVAVAVPAHALSEEAQALAGLSLEDLLDVQVTAVSRFPQRIRGTPAPIELISRAEIRAFGFQNLADVMQAFAGTQVSGDRLYSYLAVGGISPPNDFNGRFLLLIDGQRVNNALYDSIPAGRDFILDVEQIERVEFLRGPSSATYGNNALFGVINIITRGEHRNALTGSVTAGSFGAARYRTQIDQKLGSEFSMRLSASHARRDGYETAAQGQLNALPGVDGEHTNNFQFSLEGYGLRFAAVNGERVKQVPLPYYLTVPGDPRNRYNDSEGFVSLSGEFEPAGNVSVIGRSYYSYYDFKGTYPTDYDDGNGTILNQDRSKARSLGLESQIRAQSLAGHSIVGGLAFQRDFQLDQSNFDELPYQLYIDSRQARTRYGASLQDDWQLTPNLTATVGGRYDHFDDFGGVYSPRVGAVWNVSGGQTVKLQYGRAFRAPNAFERFGLFVGNPKLQPERSTATDVVWEGFPNKDLRLQAAAHYTSFKQQISPQLEGQGSSDSVGVYLNQDDVESLALNLQSELRWNTYSSLKLSATVQRVEDQQGNTPINSPRWLTKAHYLTPLPIADARLGLQIVAVASRGSPFGRVPAYALLNLTLSELPICNHVYAQFSIRNLFDNPYRDPVTGLESFGVDTVQDGGRSLNASLEARF